MKKKQRTLQEINKSLNERYKNVINKFCKLGNDICYITNVYGVLFPDIEEVIINANGFELKFQSIDINGVSVNNGFYIEEMVFDILDIEEAEKNIIKSDDVFKLIDKRCDMLKTLFH